MLRKQKKRRIITICLVLILSIAATLFWYKGARQPTFAEGFVPLQKSESKYNGDFKNEQVNLTKVKEEDFDKLIEELEGQNRELLKRKNTTDAQALTKFTKARILMLKSEKFYKLGDNIGNIGKVNDPDGFKCSEMNYILNAAYYFNRSWVNGVASLAELDDLLAAYKHIPTLHELVGIDDTKTIFYKSDLKTVKHIAINNIASLEYYCGYNEGSPTALRPFKRVEPSKEQRVKVVPVK